MGLASSLKHTGKTNAALLIPEVIWLPVNGSVQAVLLKPLETLDLSRVNIAAYVRAMQGQAIKNLINSNEVAVVQVDISELVESAMFVEQAKYTPSKLGFTGHAHGEEMQVIAIEPGIYVATGASGVPVEAVATPAVVEVIKAGASSNAVTEVEVEPGIYVAKSPEVVAPVVIAEEAPVFPSWKDGLTFDEQKKAILTSTDKAFLQEICDDDTESLKLKKLAKDTLTKLK